MARFKHLLIIFFSIFVVPASLCCMTQAAGEESPDARRLLAQYQAVKPKLEGNHFGLPLDVSSQESSSSLQVVVYGIFPYPFERVTTAVGSPDNWCKVTPLHLNIKSCVSTTSGNAQHLILYSGHKQYQPPEDAYQLDFGFRIITEQPDYLHIVIKADKGPLFTKNHLITLEAAPLDQGTTFIRFSYAYSYGTIARLAIRSYFSAMGSDKLGFSTVSGGAGEKPRYVKGVRGAVERNAVRYYLALEAYLDSLKLPVAQQFEYRISRWYDLTMKFPRQLYEMDREEYLNIKRRERANQQALEHEGR